MSSRSVNCSLLCAGIALVLHPQWQEHAHRVKILPGKVHLFAGNLLAFVLKSIGKSGCSLGHYAPLSLVSGTRSHFVMGYAMQQKCLWK